MLKAGAALIRDTAYGSGIEGCEMRLLAVERSERGEVATSSPNHGLLGEPENSE